MSNISATPEKAVEIEKQRDEKVVHFRSQRYSPFPGIFGPLSSTSDFRMGCMQMLCPVCDLDWVQAGQPYRVPGHDAYCASWEGRGDVIHVPFWCSALHIWELCFGSHEGEVFCWVRDVFDGKDGDAHQNLIYALDEMEDDDDDPFEAILRAAREDAMSRCICTPEKRQQQMGVHQNLSLHTLSGVAQWLKEVLHNGPRMAIEITDEAKQHGISDTTLRRAKRWLRVKSKRFGTLKWYWQLPRKTRQANRHFRRKSPVSPRPTTGA